MFISDRAVNYLFKIAISIIDIGGKTHMEKFFAISNRDDTEDEFLKKAKEYLTNMSDTKIDNIICILKKGKERLDSELQEEFSYGDEGKPIAEFIVKLIFNSHARTLTKKLIEMAQEIKETKKG